MIDHRRHPRFHLLHTRATADGLEAAVLNLSRSGMLLESAAELGVGQGHEFEIGDRNHRLCVAGEVRWSSPAPPGAGERYRAGVQFARGLIRSEQSTWARLVAESGETGLPVGHRPTPSATGRVPLLTILAPQDGEIVRRGLLTVIGQVRDPGLGPMIEVNGVPALVSGRRFEARIHLKEGLNLVSAAVSTSGSSVCRSPAVRVTRTPMHSS